MANKKTSTKSKSKSKSKTPSKVSNKKQFFLIRWGKGIVQYFIGSFNELKRVSWPTRQELLKSTGIVTLIIAIFTVIIYFFDTIFSYLTNLIYNLA